MEFTSKQVEQFQNNHIDKIYQSFFMLLGSEYKILNKRTAMHNCIIVNTYGNTTELSDNTYDFVFSPTNQRDYDSVRIKNLNIKEVIGYINMIIMDDYKMSWNAYYDNGGKKKTI